jgi:lipopolysaccharide heptosyltransferase II
MLERQKIIIRPRGARAPRERFLTACFQALAAITTKLQRRPVIPANPARILVVKPSALGDVLLTTPMLDALRRRFPGAAIHYAVGQYARPAIDGHPEIAHVVDCGPGIGRDGRSLLALARRIRAGRYDICLVLERSPLFAALPFLAGVGVRAGIDSAGRGFALNVRVPWDESLHEADLYLSVATAIGCPTGDLHVRFVPGPAARAAVDHFWREQAPGDRVVAIAPGGGINPGMDLPEKRWLPERFAALADRLVDQEQVTIAIVGGPLDRASCDAMRAAMSAPALDRCGQGTFEELGALLQKCALYVGNDSGPMHLAVAVNCPVVAIFGPTDVGLYGPYRAQARAVHLAVPCSPCFVHGHFPPCPNHHLCMRDLDVVMVFGACHDLLAEARA